MKILHVETGRHFYGGAQQVVWLVEALNARGIDNVLVCTPASDISKVAVRAGIDVKSVSCSGDLDLSFAWRLRQLLAIERPHIVHCHSRRGADFLGGQAAAMAGIPAVVSRRVDNPESPITAALRYRAFRTVIAISRHVATVLHSNGLQRDRLCVIRSAVAADKFSTPVEKSAVRRRFGIEPGTVALAIVSQLIPRKGHRYILQALNSEMSPPCKLIVFGIGPLERELRRTVATSGLEDTVSFAGFSTGIDEILGGFDILVHPAVREGLGVAMLKAAAAAVPVIAFDAAGASEAVIDGETGLLVPAEDVTALQAAVLRLARDPALRAQMGAAGRERMVREFPVSAMVDAHIDLYQSVLNG